MFIALQVTGQSRVRGLGAQHRGDQVFKRGRASMSHSSPDDATELLIPI